MSRCSHVRVRECSKVVAKSFANAMINPTTYSAIVRSKTPRAFVTVTSLSIISGNSNRSTPAEDAWIQSTSPARPQADANTSSS